MGKKYILLNCKTNYKNIHYNFFLLKKKILIIILKLKELSKVYKFKEESKVDNLMLLIVFYQYY